MPSPTSKSRNASSSPRHKDPHFNGQKLASPFSKGVFGAEVQESFEESVSSANDVSVTVNEDSACANEDSATSVDFLLSTTKRGRRFSTQQDFQHSVNHILDSVSISSNAFDVCTDIVACLKSTLDNSIYFNVLAEEIANRAGRCEVSSSTLSAVSGERAEKGFGKEELRQQEKEELRNQEKQRYLQSVYVDLCEYLCSCKFQKKRRFRSALHDTVDELFKHECFCSDSAEKPDNESSPVKSSSESAKPASTPFTLPAITRFYALLIVRGVIPRSLQVCWALQKELFENSRSLDNCFTRNLSKTSSDTTMTTNSVSTKNSSDTTKNDTIIEAFCLFMEVVGRGIECGTIFDSYTWSDCGDHSYLNSASSPSTPYADYNWSDAYLDSMENSCNSASHGVADSWDNWGDDDAMTYTWSEANVRILFGRMENMASSKNFVTSEESKERIRALLQWRELGWQLMESGLEDRENDVDNSGNSGDSDAYSKKGAMDWKCETLWRYLGFESCVNRKEEYLTPRYAY